MHRGRAQRPLGAWSRLVRLRPADLDEAMGTGRSSSCTRCSAPPPTSRSTGPAWPTGRRSSTSTGRYTTRSPGWPPTTTPAATSSRSSTTWARSRARAAGHHPGPVAVERLEQQPQRADAARDHGGPRRGRGRRLRGPRPALGPRRAGLPRRPGASAGGGAPRAATERRLPGSASPGRGRRTCPTSPPPSARPASRP